MLYKFDYNSDQTRIHPFSLHLTRSFRASPTCQFWAYLTMASFHNTMLLWRISSNTWIEKSYSQWNLLALLSFPGLRKETKEVTTDQSLGLSS
jgi:hypothetical protein